MDHHSTGAGSELQSRHPFTTANLQQEGDGAMSGWLAFSSDSYLKGFLAGAAVTFLLTNRTLQKTLVKGAVKLWTSVQGGVEEIKEQIQDVKAEMSQGEE